MILEKLMDDLDEKLGEQHVARVALYEAQDAAEEALTRLEEYCAEAGIEITETVIDGVHLLHAGSIAIEFDVGSNATIELH